MVHGANPRRRRQLNSFGKERGGGKYLGAMIFRYRPHDQQTFTNAHLLVFPKIRAILQTIWCSQTDLD